MAVSRALFLCCEALAALSVIVWLLVPKNLDLAVRLSPQMTVGISLRHIAPLLIVAVAGALSIAALVRVGVGLIQYR